MAYGTPTIRAVQKVFGPGNAYVVAAKRLLFGHVSRMTSAGKRERSLPKSDAVQNRPLLRPQNLRQDFAQGRARFTSESRHVRCTR